MDEFISSPGERIPVLYVFAALPVGGAEKLLYIELEDLDRSAFNPMVCCLRDKGAMGERIEGLGVPVVPLHRMRSKRFDPGIIRKLRGLMLEHRVQVVHTHLYDGGVYGRLAAIWAKVPCIVATFHNVYAVRRPRHHLCNRVLGRYTDRVVAVSEAVKNDLIRFDKLDADRVQVIYNTVDLERFAEPVDRNAVRREFALNDADFVVGCVARLAEQKGHTYLLEAMERMAGAHPEIRLLLVGDGPFKGRLMDQSRKLGIEDRVLFAGESHRVPEVLRAFDLFVLPSLWEGMPLVLGEAMVAGVPVISTDVGGTREVVTDGETGVLIPSGRPEAIVRAVEWALMNPERTRSMAANAQPYARERFSRAKHIRQLEDLYRAVLSAKGRLPDPSGRFSAPHD